MVKVDDSQILKQNHDRISNEMPAILSSIINEIIKYDPIKLVERFSKKLLASNNYLIEDNLITLSQLEFIIGILMNNHYIDPVNHSSDISIEDANILYSKVNTYFSYWTFTSYTNKKFNTNSTSYDEQKDHIISSLVTHNALVRGDKFYDQEQDQLINLFDQFSEWMVKTIGFSIRDAISFIDRINSYYGDKFESALENANNRKVTKQSTTAGNIHLLEIAMDDVSLCFKINDIANKDEISKFTKFLSFFSSQYGRDFNNNYRFPTDVNIFRSKPILKNNDIYLIPSPTALIWALQSTLETEMKKDSKTWEKYQHRKGFYLEQESTQQFKKIFPTAAIHQSLFYNTLVKGEEKKCELDCLIIYDTNIILVESKSGIFSDSAKRGGIKRLERNIKENIEFAFEQAVRARNFINTEVNPIFYDSYGNEIVKIDKDKFYKFFLVNITLENFGEVATMIQNFHQAGLYAYNEYPLSLNLNDLKIITESISYSTQFLHYIHRRVKINNRISDNTSIISTDELDLFEHYINTNLYFDETNEYDAIYIPDYSQEVNQRHISKLMGFPISHPEQKLHPKLKKIILELEDLGQFGFSNIIINLLDLNGESRNRLMEYLENISERTRKDGEFHDATIIMFNNPNNPQSGLGITLTTGLIKDRTELTKLLFSHCQLKKYQQTCYEWIGIGHYIDSTNTVDEALYMRYEEEHDEMLSMIASKVLKGKNLLHNKIGRNTKCPCGSGKKYKHCHGSNLSN